MLGVSLVRANGVIPPSTALPPHAGGRASLNTFVALAGPSGAGKGTSESAARDAIAFRWPNGESVDLPEFPIGSGEGLARTFMPPTGKGGVDNLAEQIVTAIFSVPEVDTAAGLFSRSGSTLESELRKVFSGEQLGFANAQAATRTRVPAHSYRCGLIVGVQPGRAGALLDGADGGTPQRFTWAPVLDPDMPDDRPDEPAPAVITAPKFTGDLDVPQVARNAIDAHQLAMHRGEVDPLDGHRLLVRLKVAVGLMILDARDGAPALTDEDWELAGTVMAVSDATRAWVQRERAEAARRSNRGRALAAADREEVVSDRKLQRAKQAILRWLDKSQVMAGADLRQKLKADIRDNFEPAAAELAEEGLIQEIAVKNGVHYRIADKGTPVPEVHHPNWQVVQGVPQGTGVLGATVTELDFRRPYEAERPDPARSAIAFIHDYIASHGDPEGWVRVSQLRAAGEAEGHSWAALTKARQTATEPRVITDGRPNRARWRVARLDDKAVL
ncbi:hypothetical protein NM962_18665 [Mycobacterium sp. SVM_VP21]|nr:hypothetical protein NM962_18665 [Mycobacterium sp. SVM_VP21]